MHTNAQNWLVQDGADGEAPEAGRPGERRAADCDGTDSAPPGTAARHHLGEWKAQQIQEKAQTTRERLREDYAKQAARIKLGDRCEISGYKGEVVFLGDQVEGLPGGFWVGIRYDEPVGRNDGTVKGQVRRAVLDCCASLLCGSACIWRRRGSSMFTVVATPMQDAKSAEHATTLNVQKAAALASRACTLASRAAVSASRAADAALGTHTHDCNEGCCPRR